MAADATATTAAPGAADAIPYALSPEKQFMDIISLLVMLFAVFYFMMIRPQQQREKAHKRVLDAIQKGNKVLTGGGILGTVTKVEADGYIQVEIAQGVKVRVARSTIAEVVEEGKVAASSGTANDN